MCTEPKSHWRERRRQSKRVKEREGERWGGGGRESKTKKNFDQKRRK